MEGRGDDEEEEAEKTYSFGPSVFLYFQISGRNACVLYIFTL